MYHGRFKGTHYEVGFRWGSLLKKKGKQLNSCPTFHIGEDQYRFAQACKKEYQKYFPEILDEIQGIADGNAANLEFLQAMLFSMYCFEFSNKCTCFAISSKDEILFARNSDFLVNLEKFNMNCLYDLKNSYRFNGNTTAYVQMEDGVNQHGLAVGLTFVYPHLRKAGLNAGMLVRYILEKCKTTDEALSALNTLPIASSQTFTIADSRGEIAVVECNSKMLVLIKPDDNKHFVATANNFNSQAMQAYRNPDIDDWRSDERYHTAYKALTQNHYSLQFAQDVLSGRHGFMCQHNRKENVDTVWSVVYDLRRKKIWRAEGNPSRKKFIQDTRIKIE